MLSFAKKFRHWHMIAGFLMLYDILAVNGAYLFALFLRFDFRFSMIPDEFLQGFIHFAPVYTISCILIFYWLNLYRSIWRFASYNELIRIAASTALTMMVQIAGCVFYRRMPVSYYIMGSVLQFVLIVAARFSYRFVLLLRASQDRNKEEASGSIMLIGAGNAGQMILRDSRRAKEQSGRIVCIIDDNPNKWGRFIDGVPIVGGRNDILDNIGKYSIDAIYVAIPSASRQDLTEIINIGKQSGCTMKVLPGIYQFMNGEVTVSNLRAVSLEDLLGREPVMLDMSSVREFIHDKIVLVTGGGGSIGSELCRQIAKYEPKQLIIFDIYENSAYEIQQELKREYPLMDLVVMIGSVRDSRRLNEVFRKYHPDVVYHAAAHKHVPLMEDSPCEAIKNNAIGTYKTAYAAMINGCRKFILISTDKAVNPTNIMGASKRICEKIVQVFDAMIKE
ncbi:MAG: polysaccharide biosynthesis protein, partial [Solobacterium sp.]|nr:polysaccharide biosynthesis protein [Solobacterium sp.]